MITREVYGEPLTHQKIAPGNTATGIGAEFYCYTERFVAYTSGGTHVLAVGEWIVGATSAAKAQIVSFTITSGAFADGDAAGVIRVKNQHGTFQSENLNVGGSGNVATIGANTKVYEGDYPRRGMLAKSALVTVITNTELVNVDGGIPDQTALIGISLPAASSMVLRDINEIRNFKTIDYASGSAGTVNVVCYF